jgi:cobalamin biosynthesis protein CobD/CbiB
VVWIGHIVSPVSERWHKDGTRRQTEEVQVSFGLVVVVLLLLFGPAAAAAAATCCCE